MWKDAYAPRPARRVACHHRRSLRLRPVDDLDHPDNAEVKKKRGDSNVLFSGDKVVIPDPELKRFRGPDRQEAQLQGQALEARVPRRVARRSGHPITGEPYVLESAGERVQGTTPGKGEVKELVKSDAREAVLRIQGRTLLLACSCIDP